MPRGTKQLTPEEEQMHQELLSAGWAPSLIDKGTILRSLVDKQAGEPVYCPGRRYRKYRTKGSLVAKETKSNKVKLFSQGFSDEPDDMEEKINRWLAENPTVKLLDKQVCSSTGKNSENSVFINLSVAIWYVEEVLDARG